MSEQDDEKFPWRTRGRSSLAYRAFDDEPTTFEQAQDRRERVGRA